MTRHYATVAHAHQIPVLLASMRRHCGDFRLFVLAWDYDPPLGSRPDVGFARREDFLHHHPDLEPSRLPGPPRLPINIIDTVRWAFFADVMEATGEPLTWLDGDQWFFSSPEPVYAELGAAGARFAVSPHRIPPRAAGLPGACLETHRCYGLYNSGFGWAADRAPLLEMAALTREWSYSAVRARADGGWDFGDQGHLERVAARHGAHVIQHPGVNLAPWNIHDVRLTERSGLLLVDLWPVVDCRLLVTYHYSSMRFADFGDRVLQYADPGYEINDHQKALIYEPYAQAVRAAL